MEQSEKEMYFLADAHFSLPAVFVKHKSDSLLNIAQSEGEASV